MSDTATKKPTPLINWPLNTGKMLLQLHKDRQKRFIRLQASFGNLIREMDAEITRLKEKKVSPEFIANKDRQLDEFINFYNEVEGMFGEMGAELRTASVENMITQATIQEVMDNGMEKFMTTSTPELTLEIVKKFKA